ncbi:MAG: exosortase/archaeosortase family protein [Planctomycetota bacterium]
MTPPARAAAQTTGRRVALQAAIATSAAVVACLPAWRDIAWAATHDPDSGYIALVPFVAGWLAYARRRRLRSADRRGSLTGPAIVAMGGAAYLLAAHAGITPAWHAGAVLVLVGALWSVVGHSVILRMLPAVLALFFLIPVPAQVLLPVSERLGSWTIGLSSVLLELFGFAIEGAEEYLAVSGNAGVRMIAAIGLIAYAFAYGTPLRQRVRIVLLLCTPLVAVLANVIRLVPYALLVDAWPAARGVVGILSGWLTLGLAMAMLWASLRFMRLVHVPALRYALAYQ